MGLMAPDIVEKAVILAAALVATLVVQRALVHMTQRALQRADVPDVSIFVNIVRAIVWSFALLAVLKPVFGIQPTAVVTALGVTSVVISLGLQDTVSNVIGGLGITLSHVVRPGDAVEVGGKSGHVVDINWRSTILRDRTGKEQVIPNSVINSATVTRRTRWEVTDAAVPLTVAADADLDLVTADVRDLVGKALAGRLDPDFEVEVLCSEVTPVGVRCTVHAHVRDDVPLGVAVDAVARAVAGRPWVAGIPATASVAHDEATRR